MTTVQTTIDTGSDGDPSPPLPASRSGAFLLFGSAAAMFALLLEALPIVGSGTARLLASVLGLGWLVAAAARSPLVPRARIIAGAVAAAALTTMHRCDSPGIALAAAAVLVSALAYTRHGGGRAWAVVTHAGGLLLIGRVACSTVPAIGALERVAADRALAWTGANEAAVLGPSALGLPLLGIFGALLVGRYVLHELRPGRLLIGAVGGIVAVLSATALLGFAPDAWFSHDSILLLPAIVAALLAAVASVMPRGARRAPSSGRCLPRPLIAIVPLLALVCTTLQLGKIRGPEPGIRVGFCSLNEGRVLDWRVPTFDALGPRTLGFAGLMPRELAAHGMRTTFVRERPTAALLADLDVFVTVNVDVEWSTSELKAIWRWVERGGRLLVLGDHTDFSGTRASQNDLLAPFGIEFRFDSAIPSPRVGWLGSSTAEPGPLALLQPGWGLGIGASLELHGAARPIATGGYLLSDRGNALATDMGQLGDYAFQRGERIGDLVVVAAAAFGAGEVMVFADTGPFQNPSNPLMADLAVVPVLRWLAGRAWLDLGPFELALAVLGGLLLVSLLAVARQRAWAVLAAGILGTLVVAGACELQRGCLVPARSELPVAWIETAHGPRIDLPDEARNGIGALAKNLQRAGFAVRFMNRFEPELLRRCDVLVSIAPVTPFAAREVAALGDFTAAGGLVVTAAGRDDCAGLQPLHAAYGLATTDDLVGPVPLQRGGADRVPVSVEYVEAWQLDLSGCPRTATTVFGSYHGRPLAALVEHGEGGLFHVGDTRFFAASNLESGDFVSLPNIGLLRRLLHATGKGMQ
ncbi:MAG: hypothetical protein KDE27_08525 [Planctomycetes bacterium]|nr:hypothetical protein [Planctomycetota bacterium]